MNLAQGQVSAVRRAARFLVEAAETIVDLRYAGEACSRRASSRKDTASPDRVGTRPTGYFSSDRDVRYTLTTPKIGPTTKPPYCRILIADFPNGGYSKKKDTIYPIAAQVTQGFRKVNSLLKNNINVPLQQKYYSNLKPMYRGIRGSNT